MHYRIFSVILGFFRHFKSFLHFWDDIAYLICLWNIFNKNFSNFKIFKIFRVGGLQSPGLAKLFVIKNFFLISANGTLLFRRPLQFSKTWSGVGPSVQRRLHFCTIVFRSYISARVSTTSTTFSFHKVRRLRPAHEKRSSYLLSKRYDDRMASGKTWTLSLSLSYPFSLPSISPQKFCFLLLES